MFVLFIPVDKVMSKEHKSKLQTNRDTLVENMIKQTWVRNKQNKHGLEINKTNMG
jgi:hypothetical protein